MLCTMPPGNLDLATASLPVWLTENPIVHSTGIKMATDMTAPILLEPRTTLDAAMASLSAKETTEGSNHHRWSVIFQY